MECPEQFRATCKRIRSLVFPCFTALRKCPQWFCLQFSGNALAEPFAADGTPTEPVEPDPCGAVTAEIQQLSKMDRANDGLTGGEPPHGFKQAGDRFFGTTHNRASRQQMRVFKLRENVKIT